MCTVVSTQLGLPFISLIENFKAIIKQTSHIFRKLNLKMSLNSLLVLPSAFNLIQNRVKLLFYSGIRMTEGDQALLAAIFSMYNC